MVKNDLFKQSGHWTKFGATNMYNLSIYEPEEITEMKGLKALVQSMWAASRH